MSGCSRSSARLLGGAGALGLLPPFVRESPDSHHPREDLAPFASLIVGGAQQRGIERVRPRAMKGLAAPTRSGQPVGDDDCRSEHE